MTDNDCMCQNMALQCTSSLLSSPLFAVLGGPMGVIGAAVLSPDPRMNPTMNGGSKQPKSGTHGSSHGGSHKKKNSPIPANHGGGGGSSGASKDHFVLVAAEAMPLSSAGNRSTLSNN